MYKTSKLFKNLSQTTIEDLLAQVPYTLKTYLPHDAIFTEISFNRQLGILLSGEVQIYKTLPNGSELLLRNLNADALLGLGYVWGDVEHFPATIKAVKPCSVLFLSKDALRQLFLMEPIILDNFLNAMNESFVYLNTKIELLALNSTKERLLFILTQACQSKQSITLNKSKLCRELSISRASLYRSLEQLENEHYIAIHPNRKISLCPSKQNHYI